MTNPLENICEKLTHMHKMVITWWCWHICKGEVEEADLDQVGEEKEKKRPSLGCPRVRKRNQTYTQCVALLGGGTALSGVHPTA